MGEYVTKILKCFGCIEGDDPIGFPSTNQAGSVNKDELVAPYLQVMARFRADIRNGMKGEKSDLAKAIMSLCDDFRDQKLVDLGVKLEDKVDETGNPIIKLADRDALIQEREERARMAREKEEQKRLAAEKKAREQEEKDKIAQIDPKTWFQIGDHAGKFLTFDDKGLPLTQKNPESGESEDVPKAQSKKLNKELQKQTKNHEGWLKRQAK